MMGHTIFQAMLARQAAEEQRLREDEFRQREAAEGWKHKAADLDLRRMQAQQDFDLRKKQAEFDRSYKLAELYGKLRGQKDVSGEAFYPTPELERFESDPQLSEVAQIHRGITQQEYPMELNQHNWRRENAKAKEDLERLKIAGRDDLEGKKQQFKAQLEAAMMKYRWAQLRHEKAKTAWDQDPNNWENKLRAEESNAKIQEVKNELANILMRGAAIKTDAARAFPFDPWLAEPQLQASNTLMQGALQSFAPGTKQDQLLQQLLDSLSEPAQPGQPKPTGPASGAFPPDIENARAIMANPNATPEQKAQARQKLDAFMNGR